MKRLLFPLAVLALATTAGHVMAAGPNPGNDTPSWNDCKANPREGCLDFVGPLQPSFCENNPNAPACGPEGLVQNGGADDWKPAPGGGDGAVCSDKLQICTKLDANSEIWKKLSGTGDKSAEKKAGDQNGAFNAYNSAADGGILNNLAGNNGAKTGDYCVDNNYPPPCLQPQDKKQPTKQNFSAMSEDEQKKAITDSDKQNKTDATKEQKAQKDSNSSTPYGDTKKNTSSGPFTANNPGTGGKGGVPEISDSTALTCEDFPDQAKCVAAKIAAKKKMDEALRSGAALRSLNSDDGDPNATTIAQTPERLNHSGIFGRLRGIADKLYSSIPGMGSGNSDATNTTLVSSVDGAVANANSDYQGNSTNLPAIKVTKKTGVFGGTYVAPDQD